MTQMTTRNPTDKSWDKAHELAKLVVFTTDETATVPSQSDERILYTVNFKEETCECPQNFHRHVYCKHLEAVDIAKMQLENGDCNACGLRLETKKGSYEKQNLKTVTPYCANEECLNHGRGLK